MMMLKSWYAAFAAGHHHRFVRFGLLHWFAVGFCPEREAGEKAIHCKELHDVRVCWLTLRF